MNAMTGTKKQVSGKSTLAVTLFQKAIAVAFVLLATLFATANNSYAQAPCLLGVGNCPQSTGSVDAGGGTRYYDGKTAQEILQAQNYGSRYVVVLNRYWDHDQKCYVEERAWVSSLRASGDGRVAVVVGPSRKVYIRNNALTAAQVNQTEGWLQYSRNGIYQWLKYQERVAPYLNDATYQSWAQQEYRRAEASINSFKNWMANAETIVATSAP